MVGSIKATERQKQQMREYYRRNAEKLRAKRREYYRQNIESIRAYDRVRGGSDVRGTPAKRRARQAAYVHHRDAQPCERCGASNAQRHHDDYMKPLAVRWLCPKHHGEAHREVI